MKRSLFFFFLLFHVLVNEFGCIFFEFVIPVFLKYTLTVQNQIVFSIGDMGIKQLDYVAKIRVD